MGLLLYCLKQVSLVARNILLSAALWPQYKHTEIFCRNETPFIKISERGL